MLQKHRRHAAACPSTGTRTANPLRPGVQKSMTGCTLSAERGCAARRHLVGCRAAGCCQWGSGWRGVHDTCGVVQSRKAQCVCNSLKLAMCSSCALRQSSLWIQVRLAHVLRAYEAQLKSRHFQPGDDTFFYSILLKLSLQPADISWRRRLELEVDSNAQQCGSTGHVTGKHTLHRRHSDCSHCHHAASRKGTAPCTHHRHERSGHHSCSTADAAQNTQRLALAALWTWRCHSAFDCRRGKSGARGTGKSVDGGGGVNGQCRRRVPCSVCAHASDRLLRRSTQRWRRSCTACQHTRHRCKRYSAEVHPTLQCTVNRAFAVETRSWHSSISVTTH